MKNIKIFLLTVLITSLLSVGITTYAVLSLKASLVTYDNKQTTLESLDVNGALNELGVLATQKIVQKENEINNGKSAISEAITNKGVETSKETTFEEMATNIGKIGANETLEVHKIKLGTATGSTTYNVTSYDGYQNFTADNFVLDLNSASSSFGYSRGSDNVTCSGNTGGSWSKSYNSTTGILSISSPSMSWTRYYGGGMHGWQNMSVSVNVYLIK